MNMDRRVFLKLAGMAAASTLAGQWALQALAADKAELVGPHDALPGKPGTKRWAMVIDLRKCGSNAGCDSCIAACHLTHNVPEMDNPKHEMKWIWTEDYEDAFHTQKSHYTEKAMEGKKVLMLCNHCDSPPCVRVCPTKATFKRNSDGIVMMDWHRCIGCRYCMVACPYGSRSFNFVEPRPHLKEITREFPTRARGVVEKCTFCEERIDEGRLPSCVEACSYGAMFFGDLNDEKSQVRELLRGSHSIRRKPELGTEPQVYYLV